MDKQPTISVIVYSYNSSEFIVDTLESIRNQTYPNLMLIISDDCSSDNTIEICKKWLVKNEDRFIKTKLLTSDINTGISANANRAWDACETEYFKDIAGDDLLLPDCVQDYVEYINKHPDAIVVFARVRPFTIVHGKKKWRKESWHNYGFFKLSQYEQYHYLINKGNCLPAASCFYNLEQLHALNFRHDERIPLLEDYPKWITLMRKRIRFDFLNKHTVGYRINEKSLSVGLFTPLFYKSNLLFYLYYYLDEVKQESNRDKIYNLICDESLKFYTITYDSAIRFKESKDYKVGHVLLYPLRLMKNCYLSLVKVFCSNNR